MSRCWPVDWLQAGFLIFLAAQIPFLAHGLENPWTWFLANGVALATLGVIVSSSSRWSEATAMRARVAHGVIFVPVVFTQVGLLLRARCPKDFAPVLEGVDRWLFGGNNPLEAVEVLATPWLTEVMQWAYALYIFLFPVWAILLMAHGSPKFVGRSLFSLMATIYISYVGYFLVPASGPNIHNNFGPILSCHVEPLPLYTFESDLPGLWASDGIRRWMFEAEFTKWDCFPSGHVAVALVAWIMGRRLGRAAGLIFFWIAVGVTLSTIYLRYHYVVDVLVGIVLAWFGGVVLDRWHRGFESRRDGSIPGVS